MNKKQIVSMRVRILCALLLCVMILPMAMSCQKGAEKDNGKDSDSGAAETESSEKQGFFENLGLPEKDLSKETFVVRYHTKASHGPEPLNVSRLDAAKDALSEARYLADKEFSEKTGAEISYIASPTNPNSDKADSDVVSLRGLVSSGDIADIDCLLLGLRAAGALIKDNFFCDLKEYDEYIHPEREYYNAQYNRQLTMGGKQFTTMGYYNYKNIYYTAAVHVNNNILSDQYQDSAKIEELYDLALNHKWTYEKMLQYGKDFASGDINEDKDRNTYSVILSYNSAAALFFELGGDAVQKDDQDMPSVVIQKTNNVDILTYLLEKVGRNNAVYHAKNDSHNDIFMKKQGMFLQSAFGNVRQIKDSTDIDDRVLPLPSYREGDEYRSMLDCWCTNVAGIPAGVEDADMASYCYEIYMALSWQYLYPAIYEKQFSTQYVENSTESQIFRMIEQSVYMDIANAYCWYNGVDSPVRDVINNEAEVGSTVNTIADTLKSSIKTFLDNYRFG